MRYHTVASTEGVLHRAPYVVFRCWLHVPHVTRVTGELTALQRLSNGILVADGTTGSVDKPGSLLKVLEQLGIYEPTSAFVKRAVDSDNVALYGVSGESYELKSDLLT